MPKKDKKKKPAEVKDKDVGVYCHIRPDLVADTCVEAIYPKTIRMAGPDRAPGDMNEMDYSFTRVFNGEATQTDIFSHVANPLVHGLIFQRSGVLFACGAANSGKTYTMDGEADDGIIQLSLKMLFDHIDPFLAQQNVLNQDGTHGKKFVGKDVLLKKPNQDQRKKAESEEHHCYSVFLTYYMVWENKIYDLFGDVFLPNLVKTKAVRECWHGFNGEPGCMAKSAISKEEALQLFKYGQKRRTRAHGVNPKYKQAYSVFRVKLLSAPLDAEWKLIQQHNKEVNVSQLYLVDLEGTEVIRTDALGDHLEEPECTNDNLKDLLKCFKVLHENKRTGYKTAVPLTNSTLMKQFRRFFEGNEEVGLISCISPRTDEYDKTKWMMRFAEDAETV